jgi:hypothetical protein
MPEPVTPVVDNPAQTKTVPAPTQSATTTVTESFSWKTKLPADYANSPTMKKFQDTPEGLSEAVKSHLSLESLLGNEKVPIPKSKDDLAARALFNKAMGIPDKPDGYGLEDPKLPDHIKGMTFDKAKFAEIVHKNHLTPDQAKDLWGSYTEMTKQVYENAVKEQQTKMTGIINQMRGEWGDAYQSKLELGQMVINKFSDNQEMNDFITATLASDPRGIKFLAKVGDQFAENKVGDFGYQRHSLTPEEAQKEISQIRQDPNHPYNNDKATPAERDRAIDHVNTLLSVVSKSRG